MRRRSKVKTPTTTPVMSTFMSSIEISASECDKRRATGNDMIAAKTATFPFPVVGRYRNRLDTLFELIVIEKPKCVVEISQFDPDCRISRDKSIFGFGFHCSTFSFPISSIISVACEQFLRARRGRKS